VKLDKKYWQPWALIPFDSVDDARYALEECSQLRSHSALKSSS